MGEAAGIAAYLALSEKKPIWEVDPVRVHRQLAKGGSMLL
jgi:hypothetical protein